MLIGAMSQKFQEYPNTCIFITKENSDIYHIDVYQKLKISDVPLINTEPVHSTTSLLWKKISNNETWRSDTKNLKLSITQKIKNTF